MKDYNKFRWFYTSSGELVIGGKSAEQNDELLRKIKETKKNYVIMHTSTPGSPFCVIVAPSEKVTKQDLEECAIFTGCFSRAWKQGKKNAEVHVFRVNQISKLPAMKAGTWQVTGKIDKMKVDLELVLVKQKKVYRAVPEISVEKKDVLLKVCPGKIDKGKMMSEIIEKLGENKSKKNEILAALPAGGVRIC